ncbi:tetratricopeptide repeat protein (plasmid) [Nocardiopsis flavescens]|nr:tetratricopeptide repeat protein [Nocardiopsis flavescens]
MGWKRKPEGTANTVAGDVSGTVVQAQQIEGGVGNTTNATTVTHNTVVQLERGLLTALEGLPPLVGEFVGREEQLHELLDFLDPARPVGGAAGSGAVVVSAVAGMGGVGKTALAVRAAHRAWEQGWFSGYLFVDLHGYTPGTPPLTGTAALDALLRQTGADLEEMPPGAAERTVFYRSALADLAGADEQRRPVLVVADNAHRADQVRPLLPGPGGHRLLVTSREVLAIDGHSPVRLDTLDPDDAVELLRSRLGTDDARRADQEGLGKLASRCGYLPLALKIAAALLARKPHLAPGRLAVRLGEVAKFSDAEHDLTAVFDASLGYLAPRELEVFALLGSAPGTDISTDAAAALVDSQVEDAEEVLEELAAAHLITSPAPGRWAMHDLVAAHARTLTPPATDGDAPEDEDGPGGPVDLRERALDRILDFYTVVADAADDHLRALKGDTPPALFPGREEALGWLDTEIDNLLACVRTAHRTRRIRVATRLPQCLGIYLSLRRRFTEAIEVHTLASETARQAGDTGGEAGAWNNLGNALGEVRRFGEAIEAHTRAREAFHQLGDAHGEAQAWNNLGAALREVRRFDEAIDAHTRAHDLHQQAGNAHGEAGAWNNLGIALREVGRVEEAIDAHTRARDLSQQAGDTGGEAGAWNNLGNALQEVRRFDEAINAHTRARDLYQQVGDTGGEAGAWNNLGLALQEVRRFDEAIDAHTRARDLHQQVGDTHGEATAWNNLGIALRQVGRVEEAIDAHTRDLSYCQQAGDTHGEATAWNNLGIALQQVGRVEEAIDAHTRDLSYCQQAGDTHGEATAWNNLGLALQEVRRFDEAIDAHTRARDLHQQVGDTHGEATAWNNLGLALRQVRRFTEAIEAFTRSMELFRASGDNDWAATAQRRIAEIQQGLGAHGET